jgi:hypothetical protein
MTATGQSWDRYRRDVRHQASDQHQLNAALALPLQA